MNFLKILVAIILYLFFILLNNIKIKYAKCDNFDFFSIEYKGKNFK